MLVETLLQSLPAIATSLVVAAALTFVFWKIQQDRKIHRLGGDNLKGKGEFFHTTWYDFLGDSIFSADGQLWHDARALIPTQFIKERVADLHTFERHIQHLLTKIPTGSEFLVKTNVTGLQPSNARTAIARGALVRSIDGSIMEDGSTIQRFAIRTNPIRLVTNTRFYKGDKVVPYCTAVGS